MREKENQTEQLEAFKASFELGIAEMLEMADFLLDRPKPLDPYSMGFDERTFHALTDIEKSAAQELIYQKFGLEPAALEEARTRTYTTQASEEAKVPGEISVIVYTTNQEGIYLQELTFQNGDKSFCIGPDQEI